MRPEYMLRTHSSKSCPINLTRPLDLGLLTLVLIHCLFFTFFLSAGTGLFFDFLIFYFRALISHCFYFCLFEIVFSSVTSVETDGWEEFCKSGRDRITNDEIRQRMQQLLSNRVRETQLKWLGHMISMKDERITRRVKKDEEESRQRDGYTELKKILEEPV